MLFPFGEITAPTRRAGVIPGKQDVASHRRRRREESLIILRVLRIFAAKKFVSYFAFTARFSLSPLFGSFLCCSKPSRPRSCSARVLSWPKDPSRFDDSAFGLFPLRPSWPAIAWAMAAVLFAVKNPCLSGPRLCQIPVLSVPFEISARGPVEAAPLVILVVFVICISLRAIPPTRQRLGLRQSSAAFPSSCRGRPLRRVSVLDHYLLFSFRLPPTVRRMVDVVVCPNLPAPFSHSVYFAVMIFGLSIPYAVNVLSNSRQFASIRGQVFPVFVFFTFSAINFVSCISWFNSASWRLCVKIRVYPCPSVFIRG